VRFERLAWLAMVIACQASQSFRLGKPPFDKEAQMNNKHRYCSFRKIAKKLDERTLKIAELALCLADLILRILFLIFWA
jgi:hypothetical protein